MGQCLKMNSAFVTFVIGLLVFIGTDALQNHEFKPKSWHQRVLGGNQAKPNEIPYQVSLKFTASGEHYCGGSLITDSHVLTAAHCVIMNSFDLKPSEIFIQVGSVYLEYGQNRNVSRIHVHPEYSAKTQKDDIAVLKLASPLTISESVQNISQRATAVRDDEICTVSGFGALKDEGRASLILMVIKVPIYNYNKCKELYKHDNGESTVGSKVICAGLPDGAGDACQGDSGGPLVCDGAVTGVVNLRESCARPGFPGVYTEVSKYRDWIQKAINGAITTSTLSTCLLIAIQFVMIFLH